MAEFTADAGNAWYQTGTRHPLLPVESAKMNETVTQSRQPGLLRDILLELRVHQWVKNVLVFVSPVAAHALMDGNVLANVLMTFFAFCACASGVYVVNDLVDLKTDRAHPRKRNRPIASGRLPLRFGWAAPALFIAGLAMTLQLPRLVLAILVTYTVLSFAYSAYLKTQPLVDVFTLSALYSLRVAAGGAAAGTDSSAWLLLFSGFMFLSLAFLKRVSEYQSMIDSAQHYDSRRGYTSEDIGMMKTMGVSAGFVSTLVLGLYLSSDVADAEYRMSLILWCTIPVFLFWQTRMWLSAARGFMTDDPIIYAARDWVSRLCLLVLIILYVLASFYHPDWLAL